MATLKVSTPVGEFSRTTKTSYTHVVVREGVAAMDYYNKVQAGTAKNVWTSGVHGHWLKNRGYVVSWHGSEAAARNSASQPNGYDNNAKLVGIFPVTE